MSEESAEDDAHKRYLKRRSLIGLALKRAIKDQGLYNESLCAILEIIADVRTKALQEAADRALAWFDSVTYGDDYGDTALLTGVESDQLRAAILGTAVEE